MDKPELFYFSGIDGLVYFHFRGRNAEVMVRSSQGYATVEHAEEGWASICDALGATADYDVKYQNGLLPSHLDG